MDGKRIKFIKWRDNYQIVGLKIIINLLKKCRLLKICFINANVYIIRLRFKSNSLKLKIL
jgi:hypothetical protein